MPKFSQKGFAHILVFIILLVGLVAGVYLVQKTQIFKPKAAETSTCDDGTEEAQCSATKPKFCANGQLVNMCASCGCNSGTCLPDGTCTQDSASCKPLVINGESYVNGDHNSKIDIVFAQGNDSSVDINYEEESYKSMIKIYLDTLFSYNPLNKFKDSFNIYYVLENAVGCRDYTACKPPSSLAECDFADVKAIIYPQISTKITQPPGHSTSEYLVATQPNVFVHELGHFLFKLADEYYLSAVNPLYIDTYPFPNTFLSKDECESYSKAQGLNADCEPICLSGALPNGSGLLCKDYYRISGDSIMYQDIRDLGFSIFFTHFSENDKLRINWVLNNWQILKNNESRRKFINKMRPISTIISPSDESRQTSDFEVSVKDEAPQSDLTVCYYRVSSGDKQMKLRKCNSSFTVTVGPNGMCSPDPQTGNLSCEIIVFSVNSIDLFSFPDIHSRITIQN